MNLTKERQKEKKARDLIVKALREHFACEPGLPEFTKKRIPATKYHKELTRNGIEAGVAVLVLINNMAGGSVGDINLYTLLNCYLLDPEYRAKINKVLSTRQKGT